MKHIMHISSRHTGFSLIELMISMAIGLFLMAGVFTVYINSNKSQRFVEDQVKIADDARFAMDVIGYDVRHAGLFGRVTNPEFIDNAAIATVPGECETGWVSDRTSMLVTNDTHNYTGCLANYARGDVLTVRYTLSNGVVDANINPNVIYANADVNKAQYFIGTSPGIAPAALNYQLITNVYYIASFTEVDENGNALDAIPSLRQVSLQPGPTVVDSVILSGVENMQIQLGLDDNGDGVVDSYVDPDTVGTRWDDVMSMQLWLVMRSFNSNPGLDTSISFNIPASVPGGDLDFANDGFRHVMFNTVIQRRDSQASFAN